jgi:hypothetical protein
MKYTRMKRLVFAILKKHKGEKTLVDVVLCDEMIGGMTDKDFCYMFDDIDMVFQELYREGKIKQPIGCGEWVKDLI